MIPNAEPPRRHRVRPAWHPDAKWLAALLLIMIWSAACFTYVAFRTTEQDFAVNTIAVAADLVFRAEGRIDDDVIEVLRLETDDPEAAVYPFADLDVAMTGADLQQMSSQALSRHVLAQLATVLYLEGPHALQERILDEEMRAGLEEGSDSLGWLSHHTHQTISQALAVLAAGAALLTALLVFFSYSWGRLISPGLVAGLATLPWFAVTVMVAAGIGSTDSSAGNLGENGEADFAWFLREVGSEVLPPLADSLARTFAVILAAALLLFTVGVIGALRQRMQAKRQSRVSA